MWRPFVALLLRTSIAISKETIQYCCYIENLKRCIFLSLRRTLHKMLLFFNIDFSISILITLFTTEEEEIDKLDSPSNILKCNHPSSFQTSTQSFKDSLQLWAKKCIPASKQFCGISKILPLPNIIWFSLPFSVSKNVLVKAWSCLVRIPN